MFSDLEALTGCLDTVNFITTLDETRVRSGFLAHHFIGYGVKHLKKVIVVGLDQTFGHYHSVAVKLGQNLIQLKESGRFCFIDALNYFLSSALGTNSILRTESGLKQFYEEILQHLEPNSILILDDLSPLSTMGFSDRDVVLLISKFREVVEERNCKLICGLSSVMPGCLTNYISRMSHLHFSIQDMKTGRSRDVSGHLSITTSCKNGDIQQQNYQFRLEEKNVRVFPPGTSGAVL